MKEMTYRNVDAVWFEVELFNVKDVYDPFDDFDVEDPDYHYANEVYSAGSLREAVFLSEQLITKTDYNYAFIYMCRYNDNPELTEIDANSEGVVDQRILIGDTWAEEIENSEA